MPGQRPSATTTASPAAATACSSSASAEVALALAAASSKSDQALIGSIFAEHGRHGFLAAWLRARDVGWAADLIPNLTLPEPEKDPQP